MAEPHPSGAQREGHHHDCYMQLATIDCWRSQGAWGVTAEPSRDLPHVLAVLLQCEQDGCRHFAVVDLKSEQVEVSAMLGHNPDIEIPRIRLAPTGAAEDREQRDVLTLTQRAQLTGPRRGP